MRIQFPGLVDIHTHLRVPGGEEKEDFSTGSQAAIAGGYTTILAMPNTQPPLVTVEKIKLVQELVKEKALCDICFFAGASHETIDQLPEISRQAVGLKIYMDHTFGSLLMEDMRDLTACFQSWPKDKPIAVHAEGNSVAKAIELASKFQRSVHICHVSRKEDILAIQQAKNSGVKVTCEVTPHHLFLAKLDLGRLGSLGEMRPPLADKEDQDELWRHINTTIDCIATDHAPHTIEEKHSPNPPPGVPGLETALPLMLTAVAQGKLSLERLQELMIINPRKIFNLPEQIQTWIEIDPEEKWTISNQLLFTKCKWSPFAGREVQGRVKKVVFKGKTLFEEGKFVT